ncbi:signal peptidase I [candidate division WWE3 bacterium RIFCSPHIGHO2_01_FULL_40_23]|uniref:Signal peptidase I n=1 Tax=candidate division WWE3 bacterium RIFCSPLOWO2_01_FULL_41_18 TaxID=1802625 RepID=A0A1F4VCD9_UNCKA|nr:MAG: signal peptidase I [candidate division WWE3 bacterium RIFCSPHIGHO2_01_FULL_40_23]OGC54912.1 MAG: signal peptidase I [candidate division WWE3 bacterium RIFCSPLOWO2_01_FULL_41_18]
MFKSLKKLLKESFLTALVAVLLVFIVNQLLIEPEQIFGVSMEPALKNAERVLADKIFYKRGSLKRGDIVVFKSVEDNKSVFVKRVIGLPGESLMIKEDKINIFNDVNPQGFILEEKYLKDSIKTYSGSFLEERKILKIPAEAYIVLGDNRFKSIDSREWGFLPEEKIIGKIIFRHWPPNRFGFI